MAGMGGGIRGRSGVNLLELSITVGLVAMLAAVSYSGLTEGIIRARYARALAELRVQREAVVVWRLDTNTAPRMTAGGALLRGADLYDGAVLVGTLPPELRSPGGYLSHLPRDPFAPPGGSAGGDRYIYHEIDTHRRLWMAGIAPPVPGAPGRFFLPFSPAEQLWFEQRFGRYALAARGPWSPGSAGLVAYDPTNGAVSPGWIIAGERTPLPAPVAGP
ncbi:MAG: hypothetical protein SF028_03575 [Candidatus Sumerlaeia bacterium]|nr:hypothetical protein [Candidatus Sumerlaeia bacterium]